MSDASAKLGTIKFYLELGLTSARETLAKFAEEITGPEANPAYAFEWAEGAVLAAAKVECYSRALAMLTKLEEQDGIFSDETLLDELQNRWTDEAIRKASSVPSSSSHMSNLTNMNRTAAWADLVQHFGMR